MAGLRTCGRPSWEAPGLVLLSALCSPIALAGATQRREAVTPTVASPCVGMAGSPDYSHVVVVMDENVSEATLRTSTQAPYLHGLAAQCGSEKLMHAATHPSQANYMAATSGQATGVGVHTGNDNIFHQAQVQGDSWKSYEESMPGLRRKLRLLQDWPQSTVLVHRFEVAVQHLRTLRPAAESSAGHRHRERHPAGPVVDHAQRLQRHARPERLSPAREPADRRRGCLALQPDPPPHRDAELSSRQTLIVVITWDEGNGKETNGARLHRPQGLHNTGVLSDSYVSPLALHSRGERRC